MLVTKFTLISERGLIMFNMNILAFAPAIGLGVVAIAALIIFLMIRSWRKKDKQWKRQEAFNLALENKEELEKMAAKVKELMESGVLESPEDVSKFISTWTID